MFFSTLVKALGVSWFGILEQTPLDLARFGKLCETSNAYLSATFMPIIIVDLPRYWLCDVVFVVFILSCVILPYILSSSIRHRKNLSI
jgi:hypothetical protein